MIVTAFCLESSQPWLRLAKRRGWRLLFSEEDFLEGEPVLSVALIKEE